MATLTKAQIKELSEGDEDISSVKKLIATKKNLTRIKSIRHCLSLQKLDLSFNELSNIKDIIYCSSLTWINLSHNSLTSLKGIGCLKNLIVLNASHNSLTDSGNLSDLKVLKALVLNNNQLSTITGLSSLSDLNTLVLSHNNFESIDISALSQLTKLSLSHNRLTTIPNTKTNFLLLEMRLTANNISVVPPTLQLNTRLQIIDLGQNTIKKLKSIETLSFVKKLKNVNLSGNPIKSSAYHDQVIHWLPQLHILDGTKLSKNERMRVSEKIQLQEDTIDSKNDKGDNDEMDITTSSNSSKSDKITVAMVDVSDDSKLKAEDDEIPPVLLDSERKRGPVKKRSRGKSGVISVETIASKKLKTTKSSQETTAGELDIFDVVETNSAIPSWND